MAAADAVFHACFGIQIACAALQGADGLAFDLIAHLVGSLVIPLDGSLGADDTDLVAMACAAVDGAGPAVDLCAVLNTLGSFQIHDREGVILKLASLDKCLLGAEDLADLHVRDHCLDEVEGMCADICHCEGDTCLGGIKAPFCSGVGLFQFDVVGAECEAHVDDTDLAQVAVLDHLAGLLDHLVSGVAVGNADNAVLCLCKSDQFLSLCIGEADGLLADYVEAGFQSCLCDGVVCAVGSSNGDCLDAVFALGFLCEHGLIIGIAAIGIYAQFLAESDASLGIDVKCACDKLEVVVALCGRTMDVADLAALAAADHCPANTVIENLGTVNHCFFLLVFLFGVFLFSVGLFLDLFLLYFGKSCSFSPFSVSVAGLSFSLFIFSSAFLVHQVEGFAEGCRGLSCLLPEKPRKV